MYILNLILLLHIPQPPLKLPYALTLQLPIDPHLCHLDKLPRASSNPPPRLL